jgi:hypothetical protein
MRLTVRNVTAACLLFAGLVPHVLHADNRTTARSLTNQAQARNAPPNAIFSTDMWGDIDDALALAMLHVLHDRHEVNLVGVTISKDDKWCASYVDLVNTIYRHPDIPVGIIQSDRLWRFSTVNETVWIDQRTYNE